MLSLERAPATSVFDIEIVLSDIGHLDGARPALKTHAYRKDTISSRSNSENAAMRCSSRRAMGFLPTIILLALRIRGLARKRRRVITRIQVLTISAVTCGSHAVRIALLLVLRRMGFWRRTRVSGA